MDYEKNTNYAGGRSDDFYTFIMWTGKERRRHADRNSERYCTKLDFSSVVGGSINRYEAASFYSYGSISGYDYEDTDSGVLIRADLEVGYDGTESVQKYEITAELVRNPYSCFDGYSVAAVSLRSS